MDLLNTRDPEEIQKILNNYPNLHTISRDWGCFYRAVSKECNHVADRFHLIMNLSEKVSKEIKNKVPMYINIKNKENKISYVRPRNKASIFTDNKKNPGCNVK